MRLQMLKVRIKSKTKREGCRQPITWRLLQGRSPTLGRTGPCPALPINSPSPPPPGSSGLLQIAGKGEIGPVADVWTVSWAANAREEEAPVNLQG